jgi:hypothetical protein
LYTLVPNHPTTYIREELGKCSRGHNGAHRERCQSRN